MNRFLLAFVLAMGSLLSQTPAWAHKPSDSYLTLRATDGQSLVAVRWDIALRDLDYVLTLDRDGNGELTWGEVRQRDADITKLATSRLALTADGTACPLTPSGPLMLDTHSDGSYAVLSLTAQCPGGSALKAPLKLNYSMLFDVDPSHRGLVQWVAPGNDTAQALVFGTESAEQTLALQPAGAWQTLKQYIVDGVWHIWIGYDHILFLLCLLLPTVLQRRNGTWVPVGNWRDAVWPMVGTVTMFTIAHSITLALAGLKIVTLSPRLIEPAIALTIMVAALDNIWPVLRGRRKLFTFLFGLIHGFGFAGVLSELDLPASGFVSALLQFNLGVEAGQLVIVTVALGGLFALRHWRRYPPMVLQGGSALALLMATIWFFERVADVKLLPI